MDIPIKCVLIYSSGTLVEVCYFLFKVHKYLPNGNCGDESSHLHVGRAFKKG